MCLGELLALYLTFSEFEILKKILNWKIYQHSLLVHNHSNVVDDRSMGKVFRHERKSHSELQFSKLIFLLAYREQTCHINNDALFAYYDVLWHIWIIIENLKWNQELEEIKQERING